MAVNSSNFEIELQEDAENCSGEEDNWNESIINTENIASVNENNEKKGNMVVRMELNDHKAGMEDLDKEKINQIIYEASKGSKFYENEKKKEQRVKEKIEALQNKLQQYSEVEKLAALTSANVIMNDIEKSRNLNRIIVHVDMDAFFAAVEMRDNPELKNIPMAIGGMSMLSTSNYEARRYGVRAAMPGFIAKKLCPHLKLVALNFEKYRQASDIVKGVMREYDPNLTAASLDEAYLDLTNYVVQKLSDNEFKSPDSLENEKVRLEYFKAAEKIVHEMREKIFEVSQLTASAGIACNGLLAKISSDMNKPNGQFSILPIKENILEFMKNLPIRKVFGIGRVSEQVLKSFGITTCNDILLKRDLVQLLFSSISCNYYLRVALGVSNSSFMDNNEDRKSTSHETTFGNESNPDKLRKICFEMSKDVSEDLKDEDFCSKCISIKLKLTNYKIISRSKSLDHVVQNAEEIYSIAKGLLDNEIKKCFPKKLELRLLGVRASTLMNIHNVHTKCKQTVLCFKPQKESQETLNRVTCNPIAKKLKSQEAGTLPLAGNLSTSSSSGKLVTCPVCCKFQSNPDVINQHIDSCLSKGTIKEILNVNRIESTSSSNVNLAQNSKKRKINNKGTLPTHKKSKTSVSSFFKPK